MIFALRHYLTFLCLATALHSVGALANTTFNIWYGDTQNFGSPGETQYQVNILGNVSDPDGLDDLTYSLNGGPDNNLSIGPKPAKPRRLVNTGDFNVELFFTDLNPGQNTIVLTATDNLGNQSSKTVIVNYINGNVWPIPYSIDWSSTNDIQDVAQIVDGLWDINNDELTTIEPGYDRLVAIGDISWENYEITATVTVHAIDPVCVQDINDCRGSPAVNLLVRWQGHYAWNNAQPSYGYYPIGASGQYAYSRNNLNDGDLSIRGGEFQVLAEDTSVDLPFGVPHIFKMRAETIAGSGHYYSFKVWPEGEPEPAEWSLVAQEPLTSSSLGNGSALLVAHNVIASFGNITVNPIGGPQLPMAVDDPSAATTVQNTPVNTINVLNNDFLPNNAVLTSFDAVSTNGGAVTDNGDGTFLFSPATDFVGTDTFTYTITDDNSATSTATVTVLINDPNNSAGITPDNFNAANLDTNLWTLIDPVGDANVSMTGSQLSIALPAGVKHQIWNSTNKSVRVMQSVNDADFDVMAKFDSALSGRYQSQGILVQEDDNNLIRFDFYQDKPGSTTRIYAATIVNQSPLEQVKTEVNIDTPQYLRVARAGNNWTLYYSFDGINWTNAITFSHNMTVNSLGLFAANHDSKGPAYTVLIDDFSALGGSSATPPDAVDDPNAASTPEDIAVNTINVLSNDNLLDNAIISGFDATSIQGGTVVDNGNGTFNYSPPSGFNGTDSFTYTLTDDDNESDSATVTVTVTAVNNGAPVAADDPNAATTPEDTAVNTVNVLLNDTLPDNAFINTFDATSANGGTVSDNSDGTFLYTPPSGFSGFDSFTYTLTDDDLESSTATVTIEVTPVNGGTPVAVDDPGAATTGVDTTVTTSNVLLNDTLVDNAVISDYDSASISGGNVIHNGDGTFDFTPAAGYSGSDSFTYTLTDDDAESSSATVTVSIISGPPLAVNDPNGATTSMDTPVNTIDVLANDVLVDNAVITTYDNASANGGSVVDNGDGTFYYTPPSGFSGSDSFTYTLTDDDLESSTATVTITVSGSGNPANITADNFNAPSLDTGLWTLVDPQGDTTVSMTGSQLSMAFPASSKHSAWDNGNNTTRIMQAVNNDDFDVVATFDSSLSGRYQFQGILVEQDLTNFIRFDFYQDKAGSTTRIYSASFVNDGPTEQIKANITVGSPQYLRVSRAGNDWTLRYSTDGNNWIEAGTFNHPMTVTAVGLHGGNHDSKGPAYTVLVDDFAVIGTAPTPPIAVDDNNAANTPEDTTVTTVNVLSNDTLTDNAAISAFDSVSFNGGAVTDNGDGTFNFTPASGFNGADSFTYTLIDDDGESASATVIVLVIAVDNGSPVALDDPDAATTPESTAVNTVNVLTNDTLVDNAVITAFNTVSLNGGTVVNNGDGTFNYSPAPEFNGNDSFTYTLTDDEAETSTATVTVTVTSVNNGFPVAVDDPNAATTDEDISATTINVLSNDTLVDNATVTAFDGISTNGGSVSYNGNGTFNYTPRSGFNGSDSFTYTLTDEDGESSSATVTLMVNPINYGPPDAVDDPNAAATTENTTVVTVNLLANDALHDNAALSAFDPVSANGGTITDNGDGTCNYTPPPGFNGTDSFTYTLTDDDGESDSATATITVSAVNEGSPMAVDDPNAASTPEATTVTTVNVLANDTLVDNAAITAFDATSVNGGAVVNNGGGTFDYTPAPEFNGSDSFTYTLTDDDAETSTATVTVTVTSVNNGLPVAIDDPDAATTPEDTAVTTINVLANDTLVDNATITAFDATSVNGGTVAYNGNGTFNFTPTPGILGSDTFTYTLTDDEAETSTATVTVTVTSVNNGPPVALDDPNAASTPEATTVTTVNVLANDTLIDNAVITAFDANSVNGGSVVNNGDGTFDYTPAPEFNGSDSFTYTLTDDHAETSTATVTITVTSVNNGLPVAVDDPNAATTAEDNSVTTTNVLANDTLVDNAAITAFDATSTNGGSVVHNGDGTFNYTPSLAFNGSDTFTYTLTDDNGDSATATVTITVTPQNNGLPIAVDDPDSATTPEATTVTTVNVLTNDTLVDNAAITSFDDTSVNGGTVISNGDGTFDYTPTPGYYGNDTFTYTLTDEDAESDTATVSVTVTNVDTGQPVAVDDVNAAITDEDVATTTGNVLLNDTLIDNATITAFDDTSVNGGIVVNNGDGTFNYTPASGYNGVDSFTYTLTDEEGDTSSATVSLTVNSINYGPPDAVDDPNAATTPENTAVVTANLLTNDALHDNASLSAFDAVSANGGTVTDNGDGTCNYTPPQGFNGTDSFTYTLTDDDGESDTATATIAVTATNNGVPVAVDDLNAATTFADTSVATSNVLDNDTLIDNAIITVFDNLSVHGGIVSHNGDGTFNYTPASNFTGVDAFNYTLTDDDAETSTAAVNIMVHCNSNPTGLLADDFNDVSLDQGLWTVVDPVGDSTVTITSGQLSFSLPGGVEHSIWNNGNQAVRAQQAVVDGDLDIVAKYNSALTGRYQSQGILVEQDDDNYIRFDYYQNSEGTTTRIYAATFVNNNPTQQVKTDIVIGTPQYLRVQRSGHLWTLLYSEDNLNWNTAISFTHVISVNSVGPFAANFDTQSTAFTVLVDDFSVICLEPGTVPIAVNDPGAATTNEDTPVNTINILANDTLVDNAIISVFDNNSDNGGSVLNNGDGTFNYTPPAAFVGTDRFTYTLTDDDGQSSKALVTVMVNDVDSGPPIAVDDPNAAITPQDISVTTVNVLDNDTLVDNAAISTYDAISLFGGTVSYNGDGTFLFTPASGFIGSDTFTYTLTDADSESSTATVTVTVVDGSGIVQLSSLNGTNGFVLNGTNSHDQSGFSVSSAGDINNDGIDDVVIGARYVDANGIDSGAAYVVFGTGGGFSSEFELSNLDGSNGFIINGAAEGDRMGNSVSGAGDVNGDGIDDIIIGAPRANTNGGDAGASYVIFGSNVFPAAVEAGSLDGSDGFVLRGINGNDQSGYSVSGAGDMNNDGYDDILIGAFLADPNGRHSGQSYVVFGKSSFASALNLSTLNGSNGFTLNGVVRLDRSGHSVNDAGDFNNDGFDDIIIGAYQATTNGNSESGASYVVFGKSGSFPSTLELADLDGTTGFALYGVSANDRAGRSVNSAGDVNNDGYDDVLVGAYRAKPNGSTTGAAYLIYGTNNSPAVMQLSSLDGNNGITLHGVDSGDDAGRWVGPSGDTNGDGFDDIVVGAVMADANEVDTGITYVIYGGNNLPATLPLADLDGTNGYSILGESANDTSGQSVCTAGDLNNDGLADIIIGAFEADPNGNKSGSSYVVYGK